MSSVCSCVSTSITSSNVMMTPRSFLSAPTTGSAEKSYFAIVRATSS